MIQGALPTPWKFVNDTKLLSVNAPCSKCEEEKSTEYTTDPSLLPSFVWSGSNFFTPISFWLRTLEGGADINLYSYLPQVYAFSINGTVYVAFHGQTFTIPGTPLIEGLYQCEVSDGLNTIYSEPIRICPNLDHCIALLWSNTCDLAGIPYSHLYDLAGEFTNFLFIPEAPILQSEYTTETEENINLRRQVTPLYQYQERTMRFKTIANAHTVRVLKAMELHDERDIYTGMNWSVLTWNELSDNVVDFEVIPSDLEGSECTQEIEVKFKQDDAIITGICCVSGEPEACLTKCYDVLGYFPEGACVENAYYIEDVDSGLIVQCIGGEPVTVSTTCTYVLNTTTGNYMYYNGDLWQATPDLDFVSLISISMTQVNVTLSGFTIPGTWVYISYSCDNVTFTQHAVPYTAAQLSVGVTLTIPKCNDTYYFKCSSQNHSCVYDTSDTISVTPG